MKTKDLIFITCFILLILPFFIFDSAYQFYLSSTKAHPYIMAYIKFAILATVGDMVALRIRQGKYNMPGYGLLPRMVIWGVFGMWIAAAMKCFSLGAPGMLQSFGVSGVVDAMQGSFTFDKFIGAFSISVMMNTLFAPVFMTLHKISDSHIMDNGGKLSSFLKPIDFNNAFSSINWKVQWGFVFKKTIPLFWIPAHTITFLLPSTMQVLFAASLSIVLGLILSFAALLSREK